MKNTSKLVLGLVALMSVNGMAMATQQAYDDDMHGWMMPLMSDGQFMDAAIAGQNLEVKLGELAQKNGSDTFTMAFGKMLAHDHIMALEDLDSVNHSTRSYGLTHERNRGFRQNLTMADQMTYDRLASMSGPAFDEAFRRQVMDDHKMHLQMFKMEAAHGTDMELRMYAARCIPVLKKHWMALKDRMMPTM
jgi:predicted outer membrane protein